MSVTQCAIGYYCTGAGSCMLQRDAGANCNFNGQCVSSNCVHGICCDTSCNSSCYYCPAATGKCTPAPEGLTDPNSNNGGCVLPEVCGPTGAGCVGTSNVSCDGGQDCLSGTCSSGKCAQGTTGVPCNDNQDCSSTQCVDGGNGKPKMCM
jgi:hypothetical protein